MKTKLKSSRSSYKGKGKGGARKPMTEKKALLRYRNETRWRAYMASLCDVIIFHHNSPIVTKDKFSFAKTTKEMLDAQYNISDINESIILKIHKKLLKSL